MARAYAQVSDEAVTMGRTLMSVWPLRATATPGAHAAAIDSWQARAAQFGSQGIAGVQTCVWHVLYGAAVVLVGVPWALVHGALLGLRQLTSREAAPTPTPSAPQANDEAATHAPAGVLAEASVPYGPAAPALAKVAPASQRLEVIRLPRPSLGATLRALSVGLPPQTTSIEAAGPAQPSLALVPWRSQAQIHNMAIAAQTPAVADVAVLGTALNPTVFQADVEAWLKDLVGQAIPAQTAHPAVLPIASAPEAASPYPKNSMAMVPFRPQHKPAVAADDGFATFGHELALGEIDGLGEAIAAALRATGGDHDMLPHPEWAGVARGFVKDYPRMAIDLGGTPQSSAQGSQAWVGDRMGLDAAMSQLQTLCFDDSALMLQASQMLNQGYFGAIGATLHRRRAWLLDGEKTDSLQLPNSCTLTVSRHDNNTLKIRGLLLWPKGLKFLRPTSGNLDLSPHFTLAGTASLTITTLLRRPNLGLGTPSRPDLQVTQVDFICSELDDSVD